MNYEELIRTKSYDDMTKEEIDFCNKKEIEYYKPRINKLKEKGVEDYKLAAYINDLYQEYLIAEVEPLADDVCHISDEDWCKGVDYYWAEMTEENPLIKDVSLTEKINTETKYRIDFYYWINGCGFDHIETIERTNTLIEANKYVENIDIDYFTNRNISYYDMIMIYDMIMVRVVDNENDYVLSEYWWELGIK